MNIDPRLRVQSQHAAKSITCPGMHGSSFYINLGASTAAKNAVSARHPRGPSLGSERRSGAWLPLGFAPGNTAQAFPWSVPGAQKVRATSGAQRPIWRRWGRSGGGGRARPDSRMP